MSYSVLIQITNIYTLISRCRLGLSQKQTERDEWKDILFRDFWDKHTAAMGI